MSANVANAEAVSRPPAVGGNCMVHNKAPQARLTAVAEFPRTLSSRILRSARITLCW